MLARDSSPGFSGRAQNLFDHHLNETNMKNNTTQEEAELISRRGRGGVACDFSV